MTNVGIIGGTGQLGSAIATAWLETRTVLPENLWVSNRSGGAGSLAKWEEIRSTTDPQQLAANCDVIVLCVPPAEANSLKLAAGDAIVISVMAGVELSDLMSISGTNRVVRAMSSPAAAFQLAYSPWIAPHSLSEDDTALVTRLLSACGLTDRIPTEDQIDHFTAMTGPVPGFVAYFADAVYEHAVKQGIADHVAQRAVQQLFLASSHVLAREGGPPREFVQEMIDYDGTTAAGLRALDQGPLKEAVSEGLVAAYDRTRSIGK